MRRAGLLPAILYGHGVENLPLAVQAQDAEKVLLSVSSSTLLTLTVGGEMLRVLVQDIQLDPLTGKPIHVDFHQVKLTEKIRARVPLRAVGVSPAVHEHGGVLIQSMNDVEVEALPQHLPSDIPVDLSLLTTFDDRITVASLPVPQGVEVHANAEDVVAVVTPPRTEEELKGLQTAAAEGAPEVKTEAEDKKAVEEAKKTAEGAVVEEKKKPGGKKEEKKGK